VLCLGAGIHVLGMTLSCFFTGRGDTRPVMIIHFVGAFFNIPLDYAMINGVWGFPEMGIFGAGLATVASWSLVAVLFAFAVFRRKWHRAYGIRKHHCLDPELIRRLLRYGVPGAMQFCLAIRGFTFFILVVGRLGSQDLALSNIVLSINSFAYMPMMGMSLGTSTLVGMALGKRDPQEAVEITRCTTHLILVYIFCLGCLFLLLPAPLLGFFRPSSLPPEAFGEVIRKGSVLLAIVTAYILFDALYMVFVGVLKGAGDTPFIMKSIGLLSVFAMGLPLWVGMKFFNGGLYFAWCCLAFFVFSLFFVSALRYRQGRWKKMLVIGRTIVE
jgi:MATE family multidrug resistance protein